jgi:hypothetical protein
MLLLNAYMASCRARDELRAQTIANLRATDWKGNLVVEFEDPVVEVPLHRHTILVRRILHKSRRNGDEIFLLLEDDLDFNLHLVHNLAAWNPLKKFTSGQHFFASLCNLGVPAQRTFRELAYSEARPEAAFGSQALLLSRFTVNYLLTCWGVEPGPHADVKMLRLAGRVGPIYYSIPSLVQHVGRPSLWGGPFYDAADFDKNWKAS